MIIRIKPFFIFYSLFFSILSHANNPIFNIQLEPGSNAIPSQIGRYAPPNRTFFYDYESK